MTKLSEMTSATAQATEVATSPRTNLSVRSSTVIVLAGMTSTAVHTAVEKTSAVSTLLVTTLLVRTSSMLKTSVPTSAVRISSVTTSAETTSLKPTSLKPISLVPTSAMATSAVTSSPVTTSSVTSSAVTTSSVTPPSIVRGSCTWRRPTRTAVTWLSLAWFCLEVTAVSSEICVFKDVKKNSLTGKEELVLETRDCQWACCSSSCCPPPVSLVVGTVLGSAVLVAVLVTLICCCCLYRKSQPHRGQRGRRTGPSTPSQQTSVIFHSEISGQASDYIDHSVRYNDAPPSYEEVMRGELNQTFKPETG